MVPGEDANAMRAEKIVPFVPVSEGYKRLTALGEVSVGTDRGVLDDLAQPRKFMTLRPAAAIDQVAQLIYRPCSPHPLVAGLRLAVGRCQVKPFRFGNGFRRKQGALRDVAAIRHCSGNDCRHLHKLGLLEPAERRVSAQRESKLTRRCDPSEVLLRPGCRRAW